MTYEQKNWFVDWDDPPFPQIRHARFALEGQDLMTLKEAKQDIIERFQADIEHARDQIRRVRALRVKDLELE